jgi:hypothetical protein
MRSRTLAAILALLPMGCGAAQTAVSDKPETPFKLATYEGRVGLVLAETILDIGAANDSTRQTANFFWLFGGLSG